MHRGISGEAVEEAAGAFEFGKKFFFGAEFAEWEMSEQPARRVDV